MIPKILIHNNKKYKLIKEYRDIVLYKETETGIKESFTRFQLGLVKEIIKPKREANRGGIGKI